MPRKAQITGRAGDAPIYTGHMVDGEVYLIVNPNGDNEDVWPDGYPVMRIGTLFTTIGRPTSFGGLLASSGVKVRRLRPGELVEIREEEG